MTTLVEARDELCEDHVIDLERVRRAASELPNERTLETLSETFKVLSSPSRLKIIHALSRDSLCVCDLAALLNTTESAVSHQLRLLRGMRLVRARREGKLVYYSLDDVHFEELLQAGLSHMHE
jgi:DNA-binding transcriptional ArsR family regulator